MKHSDKITIDNGNHNFILRCIDLAGNEQSEEADFKIEYTLYPKIKRVYVLSNILYIQVNQEASCSYSKTDRNFNFKDGIVMNKQSENVYSIKTQDINSLAYYIKCKNLDGTGESSPVYTVYL